MASLNDQFEHGRIPLKPLAYEKCDLSQCNELMINYGEDKNYHIYITHHSNPKKYIDITQEIINEAANLNPEISANNFTLSIEGIDGPTNLKDIIGFIYRNFSHAEDNSGFDYNNDKDKLLDPTTKNVLLQTIDGNIQLPVTSADNVYDSQGNTIQERLDNMTKLGFAITYIRAGINDCGTSKDDKYYNNFEFEYLFPNYQDMLELRIGTTFIARDRYEIITNGDEYTHGTIIFDEPIEKGRRIDLVWIFNSVYDSTNEDPEGSNLKFMSGNNIANHTIPVSKLELVSDSYILSNSNSVATSKAVARLHDELSQAIEANNQTVFYCADISDNNDDKNEILINKNTSPNVGDVFIVTIKASKKAIVNSIDLSFGIYKEDTNSYNYYDIRTPNGGKLNKGFRSNQVVKFKIESNPAGGQSKGTAVLLSGINEIFPLRWIHTCLDQETVIDFSGLDYCDGDIINVYRNGIRLFENLDYSNNGNNTITLFVRAELGERIVFESFGVTDALSGSIIDSITGDISTEKLDKAINTISGGDADGTE